MKIRLTPEEKLLAAIFSKEQPRRINYKRKRRAKEKHMATPIIPNTRA